MRLSLCKLCQLADRLEHGNPVVIGIFSRIQVREFPTRLDPCFLALEVETEPHFDGQQIPFEIRFIDQDGRVLTHMGLTLELGDPREMMLQRNFVPLPLPWDDSFRFDSGGLFRFDVVAWPGSEREQVLGGETLMIHGTSR